jgi:hypothetical protein
VTNPSSDMVMSAITFGTAASLRQWSLMQTVVQRPTHRGRPATSSTAQQPVCLINLAIPAAQ